jgi:hypothetical protein
MYCGAQRVKVVTLEIAEAGLMKIQQPPKPQVGEAVEEGLRQIAVMPRGIQMTALRVVLSQEDVVGSRN